jgi:hypothetical protein
LLALSLALLLGGCGTGDDDSVAMSTRVEPAATPAAPTATSPGGVPATWTPGPTAAANDDGAPGATFTPRPTSTPLVLPTRTSIPSPTVPPTETPVASATPFPSVTPVPTFALDQNLLPNGSFEEGWYHIGGIPELQVPNRWTLNWETGENPLDPDPWNDWVRPESRVLDPEFLPANEHDLFIWDGQHTVKIFKGEGAISFRLTTETYLEPGTYLMQINVFPDLVVAYTGGGGKVWAPDPLSGEVSFLTDGQQTPWQLPRFGQKNTFSHVFTVQEGHNVTVGAAIRGRWAIENNGWFMDDWSLRRVGG